jgi:hypothetical protein
MFHKLSNLLFLDIYAKTENTTKATTTSITTATTVASTAPTPLLPLPTTTTTTTTTAAATTTTTTTTTTCKECRRSVFDWILPNLKNQIIELDFERQKNFQNLSKKLPFDTLYWPAAVAKSEKHLSTVCKIEGLNPGTSLRQEKWRCLAIIL